MRKSKNNDEKKVFDYNKETNSKKSEHIKTTKRKTNNNIYQTILTLLIFIIIVLYISNSVINLIKRPTETVFVNEGILSKEETAIGYVIRDEEVVKGDNYKNGMEQIIDEGQKVAKDESIFRYYSEGEDDIKEEISKLDSEIEKEIDESEDNLFTTDIKMLDTQISEKLYHIDNISDVQKLQENKKNIDEYITKKAEIAGELSPKGSHLKELINERNDYQKSLTEESEYITAPRSGILSYRVDGLEETLTADDFSNYTKEFLSNLNLKTGQIISTNYEEGKIVSSFECYIVSICDSNEAKNAEVGDNVSLVLPSTNQVKAKIDNIIKENDQETTITFKIENGIDELLNYRKIAFDIIWWNSRGYKIPNSAIITEDGLNYVIKSKMGYLTKILVKLVKQTDNYSIVENYSTSEIRELNADSNARTSILLNDELILNPTKEQIDSTY